MIVVRHCFKTTKQLGTCHQWGLELKSTGALPAESIHCVLTAVVLAGKWQRQSENKRQRHIMSLLERLAVDHQSTWQPCHQNQYSGYNDIIMMAEQNGQWTTVIVNKSVMEF